MAQKFNDNDNDSLSSVLDFKKESLNFSEIDEEYVFKHLTALQLGKATGIDGIGARLLKVGAYQIVTPLTHVLNLTICTAVIPREWKKAIVSPIFKEGIKTNCNNYRPISVLPQISKILERVVHTQVYEHLQRNGLLSAVQSGFRPHHSTLTTITEVTDYLYNNMDKGEITCAVFLDLKKAFDTVNHVILLRKLFYYGICGKELTWFSIYLTNREQITVINGVSSDSRPITVGVP